MFSHALTIGSREAAHIKWESYHARRERLMAAEIDRRARLPFELLQNLQQLPPPVLKF